MKYITRFNPTISGYELHCGHLYTALVNAYEAHHSGGSFVVRVDDTQKYWVHHLGQKMMDKFYDTYIEQLTRFMKVDKFERQSNMPPPEELIEHPIVKFIPEERWLHHYVPEWIPDRELNMYPYAPRYTFEKVLWDFSEGVNWVIRGEDLIDEFSFYAFLTDILGLPMPRHTTLAKLRAVDNKDIGITTLSKTYRNYRISTNLDRLGVEGILDALRNSCLIDPEGEFSVENIKSNPIAIGLVE